MLRIRHSGVDRTWRWYDRFWFVLVRLFTLLMALIFIAWLVRALVVLIDRSPNATQFPFGFNSDRLCKNRGVECGALTGWVTSLLSLALASAVFLLWRLGRLRRNYLRTACRRPRDLVPTAGTIIGKIVGRDQLCRVVMEDLRDRRTRQPHVLVGGVGTGKTAVMVQLTELLAKRHAVPVPIRLREATELDFTDLAKKRFIAEMDERLTSTAEGEKAWRRLLRDGRIVVLADGLEEALADGNARDRDTQIRNAIRDARKRRLPLFIASRPHAPLRGMDATIHELEPLSEVDALSYITEDTPTEDDWRLSWIIEMADVMEAPLYLQITRELSRLDMLNDVVHREDQVLRMHTQDPSTLRLHLFQAWEDALKRGRLYPEVPLSRDQRTITLDWISALACAGLKNDSIEVSLEEAMREGFAGRAKEQSGWAVADGHGVRPFTDIDTRLAAAWAAKLGLVELTADRARFEHSLMQAYLGSRLMDTVLSDERYRREALGVHERYREEALGAEERRLREALRETVPGQRPRPGREFLIALVLHSRHGPGEPLPNALSESGYQPPRVSPDDVCRMLVEAAGRHPDNKALDIYAAALEIASAPDEFVAVPPTARDETHASVRATRVERQQEHITIHTAELEFGSTMPGRQHEGNAPEVTMSLSDIGNDLKSSWAQIRSDDLQTLEEAKIGLVRRFGVALRTRAESRQGHAGDLGYAQLYQICSQEGSYRVRLAGALEIGLGGCEAYRELKNQLVLGDTKRSASHAEPAGQPDEASADREQRWAWQISAWVLPLLVTSADPDCADQALDELRGELRTSLEQWVGRVRADGEDKFEHADRLAIWQEIALAQGFKYAANRRHGYLHTRPDAWPYLESQALEMLKHTDYWFSQLTLIQALTLWALPEGNEPLPAPQDGDESNAPSQPRQNPDETVERWLDLIADRRSAPMGGKARLIHPFVEAAADLASRALAVKQPGRFVWMAESDTVSRVGAGQPRPTPPSARKPRWWIPPSLGWSALDPEAQQLLADVLVLLNLAERGERPEKTKERLQRANAHVLPPCITRDRRPLEPLLTVGTAEAHQPGSSCMDGCRFQLCPYPPKGLQHQRTELGEEFCRRQYRLVRRYLKPRRHTARWQGMSAGRLRVFWSQMAERARNSQA